MKIDKKHGRLKKQFLRMLSTTGTSLIDEQQDILKLFCDTDTHITVEDIEHSLQKEKKDIPQQLIQSTLDMFCQYGIAEKRVFKDGQEYYEHKHLREHHDHMICVRCGTFIEFIDPTIENLQLQAADKEAFHPLWHTLEIYGLCDTCFKKTKQQTLSLVFVPQGQKVRIVGILGGHGARKRLADLGLVTDTEIEVINNSGPFIIAVKGSRIALGLGIARKIVVEPLENKVSREES